MNMNNVMNTMPKAVNVKGAGINGSTGGQVAAAESSGRGSDKFGDMLSKAGVDATDAVATTTEVADSAAPDAVVASTEATGAVMTEGNAELPQDPLAVVLAAAQQSGWQGVIMPLNNTDGVANNEAYTPSNLPQTEWVDILPQQNSANPNLQSVIPPTEEMSGKSRQLLDMLSGTVFPAEKQPTGAGIGAESPVDGTIKNDMGRTVLAERGDVLSPQIVRDGIAPTENLLANATTLKQQTGLPQQNLPSRGQDVVPTANLSEAWQQPAVLKQVAPGEMAQITQKVSAEFVPVVADGNNNVGRTNDLASRLWGNVPLTEAPETDILPDAVWQTSTEQQFARQGNDSGRQMFGEQFFTGNGRQMQLPEEAVGDMAPVNLQNAANNEQSAQNVGFAQTLNNTVNNEPTVNLPGNQTPASVRDDYNIQQQIVDQARLLRRGADTEMVIRLKPEHLGDLTLRVSVTPGGSVNASFHSDNAQVRLIIENSLVQLKQELADQGIKVDKVEVYTGLADGQMPQGQGRQAWQQGENGEGVRNLEADMAAFEDTAEALANNGDNAALQDGVDYRV